MDVFPESSRYAARITIIYFIVSGVWIFFSDRFLGSITRNSQLLVQVQMYKGWFFVIVTSILLFYLIKSRTTSLIKNRNRTEEALREKQVLLSELHHRVKNNLAVICSLIDLQASESKKKEAEALLETQYRIYTLADIEELLYQNEDMSRIPFHEYIEQLISNINGEGVSFETQLENLYLSINQAIPFGLLINEIFTQIRIKHTGEEQGVVEINLSSNASQTVSFELAFHNLQESIFARLKKKKHIESTLMNLYSKQLDAIQDWSQQNGSVQYRCEFAKLDEHSTSPQLLGITSS